MNAVRPSLRRTLFPIAATAAALVLTACNADGPDANLVDGSEVPTEDVESGEEEAQVEAEAEAEASGDEVDGDPAPEPDPDEVPAEEGFQDSGSTDDDSDDDSDDSSGEGSGEEDAAQETVPPNGEVVTVLSLDNTFVEEEIEIEAGTEVLWTNNGRNEHNILPVEPTQDWGVEVEDFQPGDEYSYVFGAPGEYPYFCSIHGTETVGMIGTVVVTG